MSGAVEYCFNNPLTCTDPSGNSFFSKIFKFAVVAAVGYFVPIAAGSIFTSIAGTTGTLFATAASGGSLVFAIPSSLTVVGSLTSVAIGGFAAGTIASGNFKGGVQGAFTAGAFNLAGDFLNGSGAFSGGDYYGESGAVGIATHAVVGCVTSVTGGSKCGPGALSAAFSQAAIPIKGGGLTGLVASAVIGGTGSVLGGGKFSNGALTAAFSYLFNCAAHGCQQKVDDLSQKLSNEQSATTLKFFNPADPNPLTPDQITSPASNLSADYIVSATEIQEVANGMKPFAGQVTPATGLWGTVWKGVQSIFGAGKVEMWQWSSDIQKFTNQLTDRFGAAARNGVSNAFRTRYEEVKSGG